MTRILSGYDFSQFKFVESIKKTSFYVLFSAKLGEKPIFENPDFTDISPKNDVLG